MPSTMLTAFAALACLFHPVLAQNSTSTRTAPSSSTSATTVQPTSTTSAVAVPTVTVQTAVPSPSASTGATLPSQVASPSRQAWCPSEIFCPGSLLQTVNIAHLYPDDKTFVDKPTNKRAQQVLAAFNNITTNGTIGQIVDFVNANFKGEGLELEPLALPNFKPNPAFLQNVTQPLVKAFAQTVHSFWNQLVRGTNESTICSDGSCESTLIPLNHTFVVPGGRFREQYYWDSFWIVEGLIESELFDIVNATLQNFMDELEHIGFIPNGGRTYYLDRSQPPMFIQMLSRYVTTSGDRSILGRALPLAEKELKWWNDNRSINVTGSASNTSHTMYRYSVNNTAPRPESYLTDYLTANEPSGLNETQKADLYAELATGAESGWDYTARWFHGNSTGLRALNVRNTIGVDLNSIIYRNHILLANLYNTTNSSVANGHRAAAAALRNGIIDVLWDPTKLAFYDYNLVTKSRNSIFSTASFYPLWSGIIPDEILSSQDKAFGFFASLNMVMNRYNGTFPTTFIDSGLQWDAPNTWPPHQYIILQALRALPTNVTSGHLPTPISNQSTWDLIPAGQLGLTESQLPGQPLHSGNATTTGPSTDINKLNGTVVNGGSANDGEGWGKILERELANRYITSAFCSWRATGGSIPNVVPRLSDPELNVTQSVNNTGNMFEKFSNLDVDSAGRGGEYTVQAGFGWTNGVVLWISSVYGGVLAEPNCPSLLDSVPSGGSGGPSGSGGSSNSSGNSTSPGGTPSSAVASLGSLPNTVALMIIGALLHLLL